jgi:TIR domain
MTQSTTGVAGRIFVSYRREETAYAAGWLFDRLAEHFGEGQIFKDVDSIALGDDFVEVITNAVASCDVLLALIGDQWLTITDEHGKRRLDHADDFVRLEIEAALTRKVLIIPILIEGAQMPRADQLPASLARLVRRQALELSPSRFASDTGRLLRVLDTTLGPMQAPPAAAGPGAAMLAGPVEPGAGTHRRSVAAQAAEEGVVKSTAEAQPTDASAGGAQQAHKDHEYSSVGGPASIPSGGVPGPGRWTRGAGKPPGGQRRSISTRAKILAGTSGGVVLVIVLVAVMLASPHTTSPPAGAGTPTSSPTMGVIFQDDFSSRASGWDDAGNQRIGGHYKNGAYLIYSQADGRSAPSSPRNARSVFPAAPPNLRVEVEARRIGGPARNYGYSVLCRSDGVTNFYAFTIRDHSVGIEKYIGHNPYYYSLTDNPGVDPNSMNRIQGKCSTITVNGQQAVHLVLWVNGRKVAEKTDTKNPLLTGTVGLLVFADGRGFEAEFDNFSVTRL